MTGRERGKHPVSYYDFLNVSPQDSDEAIKHSYNKLALKFHPDQNPQNRMMSQHRFNLICEAYAAIRTPEKRARYDQWLSAQKPAGQADNDNVHWRKIVAGLFSPKRSES